mmetsp:Transcript_28785/g.41820  ORF Transcript_28785/g.41820 Transcript_28785/m.41820 type:complete len:97 (+) Transcript_28785:773-1063(+)
MSNESGEAARPKFATELNMTAKGTLSLPSEDLKKSRQSGVVAIKRPINTPFTGGGRADFNVTINFSLKLIVPFAFVSLRINIERPNDQKKGDHPTR